MNQFEMICLDKVVLPNHRYRRFMKVWDFKKVDSLLKQVKSDNPHEKGMDCQGFFAVYCCSF